MNRPVAERDAVAEAVLASCAAKLPVQPDVLPFGVRVEAGRLHADADRRSRRSSLNTCTAVWQGVVLPARHRAGLQRRICGSKNRGTRVINRSTCLTKYWNDTI